MAEVAREELRCGVTCGKGEPDGHSLLIPLWCDSRMFKRDCFCAYCICLISCSARTVIVFDSSASSLSEPHDRLLYWLPDSLCSSSKTERIWNQLRFQHMLTSHTTVPDSSCIHLPNRTLIPWKEQHSALEASLIKLMTHNNFSKPKDRPNNYRAVI